MDLRSIGRKRGWSRVRHTASVALPVLVLLAVGSVTLTSSPHRAAAQAPDAQVGQASLTAVQQDESGTVTATVTTPPSVALDGIEALVDGTPQAATFELVSSGTGTGSLVIAIEASANTAPSVLAQSQTAAYALLDSLPPQVAVAVVAYGDSASLLSDFTTDRAATRSTIGAIFARGASALYDAVWLSGSILEGAPGPRSMAMFGWGWEYGGGSTASRAASLQRFGSSATAHVFALGGEHDVRYAGELTAMTGGAYHLAVSPTGLDAISSRFAPESATYNVRVDAPVVASGAHNLTLRLSMGGTIQEVSATFETAVPAGVALGMPSPSADGSRIEVPIEALASLEALGDYSIEASSGETALSLASPQGPIVIDAWQFAAGALPLEVRVLVGAQEVSRLDSEVNVAPLQPELNVERREASGDASGEELAITWRAQGGGAELLVMSGDDEVIRTDDPNVLVPIAEGAPVMVRVVRSDGSVLAEHTDGQPQAPVATAVAPAAEPEGGRNLLPLILGMVAVLAIGGAVAAVLVRFQMHRRWLNAPGAGAITAEHLYTALTNGEMTLHYQPILDVRGDRLVGVEALVRWEHPVFGTVSPRRFLAKADSTGVMRYLGEFVLKSACDFVHELHESRLPGVRLTVNASASQLQDPEFPVAIERALKESGLEPECLEIEVNERASLAQPAVVEALERVRALGVAIGLDDFWSESLNADQLTALGVSSVKVDLWSNTGSPGARLRIREAVDMARSLGLTVTAKRVETLHEVEFLGELHCDYAQGHAFNEPMPEDVFLARMGLFEEEERLAS